MRASALIATAPARPSPLFGSPRRPRGEDGPSPVRSNPRQDDRFALLQENAALIERNAALTTRVEDMEKALQRLWQHGPSKGARVTHGVLCDVTTSATAAAARDRQEAEEARHQAATHFRDALQAKQEAHEAYAHMRESNIMLESERARMREWHVADAQDLSQRMHQLSQQLSQEQTKVAMSQVDAEFTAAGHSIEIGNLVGQLHSMSETSAEQSRRQHAENAELAECFEATRRSMAELRSSHAEERRMLEHEVTVQAGLLARAREEAKRAARLSVGQLTQLSTDLSATSSENVRLRRELDHSRSSYVELSMRAREDQLRMSAENQRMQILVGTLGVEQLGAASHPANLSGVSGTHPSSAVSRDVAVEDVEQAQVQVASKGAEPLPPPSPPLQESQANGRPSPPGSAVAPRSSGNESDTSALLEVAMKAAESRKQTLAALERLVCDRDKTIQELRSNLKISEQLRRDTTRDMQSTIDKLRWLQSKALKQDGSAKSGRFRSMMYWENMKTCHASSPRADREVMLSWRGDDDQSKMTQQIDLAHLKVTAAGDAIMRAVEIDLGQAVQ